MIIDLQSDSLGQSVSADICIIGGGAAGITMALELVNTGWDVVVLESGGREYEVETQNLYAGENVGRDYYLLQYDRVRYLGGTTHHWGGWCVPLTSGDLQYRDWVPNSGWPIAWNELNKYYDRAQSLCELDRLDFAPSTWLEPRHPLLNLDESILEHYLYKWSPSDQSRPPTHFGRVYRTQLERARNVRVILHANVVDFECSDGVEHVQTVTAKSLQGQEINVAARCFVLAAGGLENPRLMLAANRQSPAGLGNGNDLVGRFFMEHLEGVAGHILVEDAGNARWLASYEKRIPEGENTNVSAAIRPNFDIQSKREILNAGLVLRSQIDEQSGYVSAKRLALSVLEGGGSSAASDIKNVLLDLDEVALWIHHRRRGTHYEFPITRDPVRIWVNSEQAPNPDSRVFLTGDLDELGVPRIALDWRIGQIEKRTIAEAVKLLAGEIGRIKGMRVRAKEWLMTDDDHMPETEIYGGHHHMGTTRMSDSAVTGVVDPNCRVFGIDNLYVAGSSVFPTSGYANPTLTLIALAVRLTEHVESNLSAGVL